MATQKRAGGIVKNTVPLADRVRNVLQSVENLFDLEMVNRVFEDASIPDSKLVSGGGGGVTSVFARTGDVVATSGDYTASQVGALPELKQIRSVNADDSVVSTDGGKMILVTDEAEIYLPDGFSQGFQIKIIRYTSADVSITSDTTVTYLSAGLAPIGASTLQVLTESDIINIGSDNWFMSRRC